MENPSPVMPSAERAEPRDARASRGIPTEFFLPCCVREFSPQSVRWQYFRKNSPDWHLSHMQYRDLSTPETGDLASLKMTGLQPRPIKTIHFHKSFFLTLNH